MSISAQRVLPGRDLKIYVVEAVIGRMFLGAVRGLPVESILAQRAPFVQSVAVRFGAEIASARGTGPPWVVHAGRSRERIDL